MNIDRHVEAGYLAMNDHPDNQLAGRTFSREDLLQCISFGQRVTQKALRIKAEDIAAAIWILDTSMLRASLPTYQGVIAGEAYEFKIGAHDRPHFIAKTKHRYRPTRAQISADIIRHSDGAVLGCVIDAAAQRGILAAGTSVTWLRSLQWEIDRYQNDHLVWLRADTGACEIELLVNARMKNRSYWPLAIERRPPALTRALRSAGFAFKTFLSSFGRAHLELQGNRPSDKTPS